MRNLVYPLTITTGEENAVLSPALTIDVPTGGVMGRSRKFVLTRDYKFYNMIGRCCNLIG